DPINSQDEMEIAIASLKGNRAPGPDGYDISYYKLFRDKLSPTSQLYKITSCREESLIRTWPWQT
ncbi:Hypothetical predicted protein, partial [Pelobates cultripes]